MTSKRVSGIRLSEQACCTSTVHLCTYLRILSTQWLHFTHSSSFDVSVGSWVTSSCFTVVRQGCVLAPDSFDTAMDWILCLTVPCSVPGLSIRLVYFTDLDYLDYVALLVELLDLLETALINFSDEASKLGLRVNWKKTGAFAEWCLKGTCHL